MFETNNLNDFLIDCRHTLHRCPELKDNLPETTAFVCGVLDCLGIDYEIIEKAGIVAVIGQGEKTVVIREDMDALEIREDSGEYFASGNGYMHACGHDLHTTFLLGAARLFKENEIRLPGKVVLFFQYNEEGMQGARALLKSNYLTAFNVVGALAIHVLPGIDMEPGTFMCVNGAVNTSVSEFKIEVEGKECHGAMPFLGKDPISTAIQVYNAVSQMILRETDARDLILVSPCYFNAGSEQKYNIVPGKAVLGGTVRSFKSETYEFVKNRIITIVDHICQASGVHGTVYFSENMPACINDALITSCVINAADSLNMSHLSIPPQMCSDDFGAFSDTYPSAYVWLGAGGSEEKYRDGVLHSSKVCYNDAALVYGTRLLYESTINVLNCR